MLQIFIYFIYTIFILYIKLQLTTVKPSKKISGTNKVLTNKRDLRITMSVNL